MRLKYLLMALLVVVILTATASFAFAEEVKLSDISFDVPGNFTVSNSTDVSCIMKSNSSENYTISFLVSESSNANVTKNSRVNSGFEFLSEDTFNSTNNISVYQQSFRKNESFFSYYTFDFGEDSFLIVYTFPVHDELDVHANPVMDVIDSIR